MEENLRRLTDEIGGRVTGSPEMAKAVEWGPGGVSRGGSGCAYREVHAAGDVERRRYKAGIAGPGEISRAAKVGRWSPATPAGGIEGQVVDVGYGATTILRRRALLFEAASWLVHSDIGQRGPIFSTNICGHH